mmetsp:Transcript_29532/g.87641  ORF Transcript_29532/g.87641 Transcript_29532/m.87641 type:complete len:537 (+) Transcript_29532:233-1843(+)
MPGTPGFGDSPRPSSPAFGGVQEAPRGEAAWSPLGDGGADGRGPVKGPKPPCSTPKRFSSKANPLDELDMAQPSEAGSPSFGGANDMVWPEDRYHVICTVGEGCFGSVALADSQLHGCRVAVKCVKPDAGREVREVELMRTIQHPNVVPLLDCFEAIGQDGQRSLHIVMEYLPKNLHERIAGRPTGPSDLRVFGFQMLRALAHLDGMSICHRDLKPENFLFMTKESIEKNFLKIIDFGLSCKYEVGQVLTTKAGTPYYVAPQVLAGKYDQLSDLWSCGVIMYVMLCGYPPFFGESDAEVLSKVRLGNFSFNAADWKNVSEDAKNLIRMLLKMNPRDRYTAEQSLNHEWIKNTAPKAANVSLQNSSMVDNLRSFRSQNKLKKAALHIIAGQLNEDQIKQLRDVFMALDENGDGLLTSNEMKEGLQKAGLKEIPPDLQQIMEDVDADGSGVIDYTEFLAATLDRRMYVQEDVCWAAFRVFDRNGDGQISEEELKAVLNDGDVESVAGAKAIAEMMKKVDKDGDNMISFEEFMEMMRKA